MLQVMLSINYHSSILTQLHNNLKNLFYSLSSSDRTTENERFNQGVYISPGPSKCSILLNNVFKTHKNKSILNGLNLKAYSGQM